MADDFFWHLKKEIEQEYHSLSLGLSNLTDDDLNENLYRRFSGQIDHLQELFDRISVVNKDLDLDQSNPDLYKLLEAKQELSDRYGQFNRQRSIFFKRFAKFRNAREDELVHARTMPEEPEEPEVPEEMDEELPEVALIFDEDEEELDPEAAKKAKQAERQARQKKLAAEARKRDQRNQEQRLRQEEAERLGKVVRPGQSVSEADLYQERIRREEDRLREESQREARIREENEALRRTRERLEQSERFEHLESSHIDMSREGIGHHSSESSANTSDTQSQTYSFVPCEFTPSGVAPTVAETASGWSQTADSNAKLYSSLVTNRTEPDQDPVSVSAAIETQMRFNVERARLACLDAQGTPASPEAVHEYIVQRNALEQYRSAVKEGAITVSPPLESFIFENKKDNSYTYSPPSGASTVYSFTPTGVVGQTIDRGELSGTRYEYMNPGMKGKPAYSPANPMVVSAAYEEAITRKMHSATSSLNDAIAQGGSTVRTVDALQMKMYTDAYLGFQHAKRDGTVVVSSDGSGHNVPDYQAWQQKRNAQTFKGISSDTAVGLTGQMKGPNPNQVTKKTVDEAVTNIFNQKSHLTQQSIGVMYAKQVGGRFQSYSYGAALRFSQQMYRMIQNGDDNSLRTMEQGRYYITTAAGLVLAANGSPVKNFENRVANASAREFNLYGTKALLTNSQLSATVNNSMRVGRELDDKIKVLEQQLAPFQEKINLYAAANPYADKLGGLDSHSRFKYEKLTSELTQLREERLTAGKTLKSHQKLQALRHEAKVEADLLKKLETDGKLPQSPKKIQEAAKTINAQANLEMQKKYGALTKVTDKSLEKELALLKKQGNELKKQIKLLESKGAALSPAERKLLMELKAEAKKLGQKVGIYTGLGRDRANLALANKKLDELLKKTYRNRARISNGLYALQSFLIRPLQAGVESNTEGLARMAQISSNRYVHILVKKSFKASVFMAKGGMELLAPGSVQAAEKALFIAKTIVKANVGIATNVVKTAVHTGVHAVGTGIYNAVPTGIKTGVHTVASGAASMKSKFDTVAAGIKNALYRAKVWAAKTRVGRGIAAIARFNKVANEAIKAAMLALKGFALKGLAAFALVFLLVGFMSICFGAIGGVAGSSIIASPDESNNKVDLSKYVAILNGLQTDFQGQINSYYNSKYDKVTLRYGDCINNTKQILCMMAVRNNQNLDMTKNAEVEQYLRSLFNDSHIITTSESTYKCEGCKEKEEFVYWFNPETHQMERKTVIDPVTGLKKYLKTTYVYCPGHLALTIKVTVLSGEDLYLADSSGNAGQTANAGEKIGNFKITYYCCEKYPHICNAGPPYKTASGTTPTPNRTIAVDPSVIPLGSHVIIDGKEYVAEDTGGAIDGNRIDIVVATHSEALNKGTRSNVAVYKPSYSGGSIQQTGEWNGWTQENIDWCELINSMPWGEIYTGAPAYGNLLETGGLVIGGDFVWPVGTRSISSPFGWRIHPVTGERSFHNGVDIPVHEGTLVHSAAGGTVTAVAYNDISGNFVTVNHGGGITTSYLHLKQANVSVGQWVEAGQVVGLSGNTGRSTGPHLHFNFHINGTPVDPRMQYGF